MTTSMTAVATIAGIGAFALLAATQYSTDAQADNVPTANTHGVQGMTVVRDAETGALRAPNAREASRYALRDASQSSVGQAGASRIERRADGSITARLDASHMMFSTVTRRADGSWERHCGMDHDHTTHASPVRETQQ